MKGENSNSCALLYMEGEIKKFPGFCRKRQGERIASHSLKLWNVEQQREIKTSIINLQYFGSLLNYDLRWLLISWRY